MSTYNLFGGIGMSENPVFDTNNILGDGIYVLNRSKLVALAIDLCTIAFKERRDNGYRGGIRPDNISIDAANNIAIGPAEEQDKEKCAKNELEYISPEFFWSGNAGSQADVYAIGLLLYNGITGHLPFVTDGSDSDCAEAFRKRMNGDKIKVPSSVGKKLKSIIEQATAFSAGDRYENTLQLAEELKSLLVKPNAEAVSKAAEDAFGKPESELTELEQMMLGIITNAALCDDLADVPLEEQEDDDDEEEIEVEIEELPPEPDEPEDVESIEVEIEELPPEPYEPEDTESLEVEIVELPPEAPAVKNIIEDVKSEEAEEAVKAAAAAVAVEAAAPKAESAPIEVPEFINASENSEHNATPKKAKKRPKGVLVIISLCAVLAIAAIIFNKTASKNADGTSRTMPPITYVTPEPSEEPEESKAPKETPEPTATPEPTPTPKPEKKESSYQAFTENISWDAAEQKCKEQGGHLVAINDEEEFAKVCEILNGTNAKYAWVGCYRSSSGNLTWTNGDNIEYYVWAANEPSYTDGYDGAAEDYIMLVRQADGSWKYNDSRINPVADYSYFYNGLIAYVCEISE